MHVCMYVCMGVCMYVRLYWTAISDGVSKIIWDILVCLNHLLTRLVKMEQKSVHLVVCADDS